MGKKYFKLSDVVELMRGSGYGHEDQLENIVLCLESEEWTWINLNLSSGVLDDIGDYVVEALSVDNNKAEIWIKTKSYNVPMIWSEWEVKADEDSD